MKNKIKKLFALGAASLIIASSAMAIDTTVINERWGKPIFVYGSGLSKAEIESTASLLGIENKDNVNVAMVNGQDEIKYLGTGTGDDSAMISSVLVQKKDGKNGVDVEIKSPGNITQITADQYRNASITAGVTNASIIVGSVKPVTGESALTGIYKAFEANGEVLDHDRMVVAQEELEVTNDIIQENLKKENFDVSKLNEVIVEVKQEINNYYNSNETKADAVQIENFIVTTINKYELNNVVTQDQIDRLVALFEDYQQTGAVDSQAVMEELSLLKDDISKYAGQIYEDAKEAGILDKIGEFFKRIIEAISRAMGSKE